MNSKKSIQDKTKSPPRLTIELPDGPKVVYEFETDSVIVGRGSDIQIRIPHPSVSLRHAELTLEDGRCFLKDLNSSNGTRINGKPINQAQLHSGDLVEFGEIQAHFKTQSSGYAGRIIPLLHQFRTKVTKSRFFAISVILHVVLTALLAKMVFFSKTQEPTDFTSEETHFLVDTSSDHPAQGGHESAAAPGSIEYKIDTPSLSQVNPNALTQIITTVAPSAISISAAGLLASHPSTAMASALRGDGGTGAGMGKAFSQGSGLGQGLREWIGSGTGGIGISGRGKTLKTVNEFSCYFVIHSGDWYAALDWRNAPDARQKEISYADLPDAKNLSWYETNPIPAVGPFISYFYGFVERPNHPHEVDDARGGCVEFTPGAMSNLLRFIRQASNNNIKGGAKPKAVVLDKSLLPYTYDKNSNQITWNPEGREKLRETLRQALPKGGRFGSVHGYLWNPQPLDKQQSDFLVEYLLDVKPMPPFIYFTGNDDFTLSDTEVETLNEYIRRGGAVWGDSGFAGNRSKFDVAFRREMRRVIPDVDKDFHELPPNNPLFIHGDDAYFDMPSLPPGMQYYQSPIEVIEITPGVISVVLTKNAYGNFLRYELTSVNNSFQVGGTLGRGMWVNRMWEFRDEFFRGINDDNVMGSYSLGSNILVYMLGRWPAVLNRLENR